MGRTPTLHDHLDAVDAARFRGRDEQLQRFEAFLRADGRERILFVSGPGGSGKSALLRAMGRSALAAGRSVVRLDGRTESESTAPASVGDASVVFIDEADAFGASLDAARDHLVHTLPADGRLVVAGRAGPGPRWREHGLDAVLLEMRLGPLAEPDARSILADYGITDAAADEIVRWAQGSPLALTVAALPARDGGAVAATGELEARLVAWLTGHPTLGAAREAIEIAAIAPAVDARLLAAALPGRPTRGALAELMTLPVVENVGGRGVLHAVLAAAVRERLRTVHPERWQVLRRRIAEHLGARARLGDMTALLDLSHLVDHPILRQMVSHAPSPNHYLDTARPGEVAAFLEAQGFAQLADRGELVAWSAEDPRLRLVVRCVDGRPAACAIFAPLSVLAPVGAVTAALRDASVAAGSAPETTLVGWCAFAEAPHAERIEVARLAASGIVALHGRTDLTTLFVHFPAPDRRPLADNELLSRPATVALDRPVIVTDFRPLDVAGFVATLITRGLQATGRHDDALRMLSRPPDDPDRVALLDRVFGDDDRDRRLRRVLELAHGDPPATEASALAELHVSRRTWFRLLREARERVARAPD